MATVDDVKAALAKLQDDVTSEKAVEQGAVALLQGLNQLLKDAVASSATFDELQSAVTNISTQVEANTADLSAAVTANTPPAA